jgi:protein SCO1
VKLWTLVAAGCAVLWLSIAGTTHAGQQDRVLLAPDEPEVTDFSLTGEEGQTLRLSSLRGRSALVFFGFTHCPGVCPATMFKLRLLSESLEQEAGASPLVLFVSVDGDRDTPGVMKAYLESYPENFVGLTGDPRTVRTIAAGFKAVFFKGLPSDSSGEYLVEHTSQVYLVDERGRLRATFFDAPVEIMAKVTRDLSAGPS